jgi:hypothetical protein
VERRQTLEALAAKLVENGRLVDAGPLVPDDSGRGTHKAEGYGEPWRISVANADGQRDFVLHTCSPNDFGHDRRSDRAQQVLLAFDTFDEQPGHVRACDVGAIVRGHELLSLRDAGELYLVTEWAPGRPYADDLRRIAENGRCEASDLDRCDRLAAHLVALHAARVGRPEEYRRAIRDLVGHGEGIFGIVDGYPRDTPSASPARLQRIEQRALAWRWQLRDREARVARTHGDFHPFNIVFDGDRLTLLDASRGGRGDPADDVAALTVNYLFFAVGHPASWRDGFAPLWTRFFHRYLDGSGDRDLLSVIAPFWAWRTLVVCCPRFYPALAPGARDRLLSLAERVLEAPRFDLAWAEAAVR